MCDRKSGSKKDTDTERGGGGSGSVDLWMGKGPYRETKNAAETKQTSQLLVRETRTDRCKRQQQDIIIACIFIHTCLHRILKTGIGRGREGGRIDRRRRALFFPIPTRQQHAKRKADDQRQRQQTWIDRLVVCPLLFVFLFRGLDARLARISLSRRLLCCSIFCPKEINKVNFAAANDPI